MNNSGKFLFGSPAIIQKLDQIFGSEKEKQKMKVRDSDDVRKFLEDMDKWEKNSTSVKMIFR